MADFERAPAMNPSNAAALADLHKVVDLKPRDLFEAIAQAAAKAKIKTLEKDTCGAGGQRDARCL